MQQPLLGRQRSRKDPTRTKNPRAKRQRKQVADLVTEPSTESVSGHATSAPSLRVEDSGGGGDQGSSRTSTSAAQHEPLSTIHADPFPEFPADVPLTENFTELQPYSRDDLFNFDFLSDETLESGNHLLASTTTGIGAGDGLNLGAYIDPLFDDYTIIRSHLNPASSSSTSLEPRATLVHQVSSGSSGCASASGIYTPDEEEEEELGSGGEKLAVDQEEADKLLVVAYGKRKCGSLNAKDREDAARTRQMKACVRCRAQNIKCRWDKNDPTGDFISCKTSKVTVRNIPCLRYKLVDFAIFRPWRTGYTECWQKLKMRNVTQWASPEIGHFTIRASVFPGYKITVRHRKFVPIVGDKMERKWVNGKQKKAIEIPPYAILNMDEAAQDFRKITDETAFDHVDEYLKSKHADELVQIT